MEFEWDPAEEAKSLEKHGIPFVYAMRDGRQRVISARRAREHEEAEFRKQVERGAADGIRE